jgi:serine/threonine-protein kinase
MPPPPAADRNLLFGVLALQADLLDAARFAEACSAWAARKDTPLADLLVERRWLTDEQRAAVEVLLATNLHRHGGDAIAGLRQALSTPALRGALESVADPDVRQSLADVAQPAGLDPASTTAYEPGSRQRYTLTRLHAQGGIGQVWLAHDEDLGRDVALKELRPESQDSPAAAARFLEEAKVTGQLEHPGIVPVYELVRPRDGRPCYAMRFVGGGTLADAVRAYHRKRGAGQAGPLDLRELLAAFVAACNAVAYAHARGVLHRDLKPQNVALGDFGEVLVLDWGLAKVVGRPDEPTSLLPLALGPGDGSGRTQQGQVLGTPAYMAPEQAEGRLDRVGPRTDVYGLGAVLYEVLTGAPPFDGADTPEVLRKVIHEPPTPPRRAVAATPAALEAVCLKALAKRPEERYPSAAELAHEVRRWLADEPVAAYRDPLTTRLGRWGRRHRPLVAAAAAVLVAATAALAAGTLLLGRANAHTERARRDAQEQRDRAEASSRKARQAVDDYFTQVSENKLLKSPLPGLQPLRKELLETALRYYQGFAEEHGDDPALRAELARAFFRVGSIRRDLGARGDAFQAFQQSRDLWERLTAEAAGDAGFQDGLAQAWLAIGLLQTDDLGRAADGLQSLQQARAIYERLTREDGDNVAFQNGLASCYQALGRWHLANNQPQEELPFRRKALAIAERLAGAGSDDRLQFQLARFLTDMGYYHARTGDLGEALRLHARAQHILEQLVAKDPADLGMQIELGRSYTNQGWANLVSHRYADAAPFFEKVRDLWKRLAAENPRVREFRERWAGTLRLMADLQQSSGRYPEALQSIEAAVAMVKEMADGHPEDVGLKMELVESYAEKGNVHGAGGDWRAALQAYRQGLDLEASAAPEQRRDLEESEFQPQLYLGMAEAQDNLGNPGEALAYYDKARAWLGSRIGGPRPNVWHLERMAAADVGTAQVHLQAGKPAEALPFWERARAVIEKLPEERSRDTKARFWDVGRALVGQGKTDLSASGSNTTGLLNQQQYERVLKELLREATRRGAKVVEGALEAELLPVVESKRCPVNPEWMNPWGADGWSNSYQLFCRAEKGSSVVLGVTVPAKGDYQVAVYFTKGPDYGIVEVSVDDRKLGKPFDSFDAAIIPSGKIEFGTVALDAGAHRMRFAAIDTNPKSSNYFMGIDCLTLERAGNK